MTQRPLARLALLAIDQERTAVVVDSGALPVYERPLEEGDGAFTPAWNEWSMFGLEGPLLDTVLDPTRGYGGTEPYTVLVVMAPQDRARPLPGGWTWHPLDSGDPSVPEGVRDVVRRRLEEIRGDLETPGDRPDWCRPGWHDRAFDWIEKTLVAAGRQPPTKIAQVKVWGISTVLQADAPDGRSWCKASSLYFGHEGPVTELLRTVVPDHVPEVLGIEPHERWLLLEDFDGTIGEFAAGEIADLATTITDVHAGTMSIVDEALALGCPDRSLDRLADGFAAALATDLARTYVDATGSTAERLAGSVNDAIFSVKALGVPETIVHGDLHPGNVAMTRHGPVVFDWTDACRCHPAIDVVSWTEPFRSDAERVAATWAAFRDAWVERFGVAWFEPNVRDLEMVGQAFLLESYVGIVSSVEPDRRRECSAGITDAFDRLCELTAADS